MSVKGAVHYSRQLSPAEIAAGAHRAFVGGRWDEIGRSQFEFMKQRGLLPEHKLVDIGCGALRGGIHLIRYLHKGNYFGIDINRSLVEAGKLEVAAVGLSDKEPNLLVSDEFELSRFGTQFDYALAISFFTHLYMNHIVHCLVETNRVLKANGKLYATFFESPYSGYSHPIVHGEITTNYVSDPFHYSLEEMKALASVAGMGIEPDDWCNPRRQKMLCITQLAKA